jgi:uncharacterized protein
MTQLLSHLLAAYAVLLTPWLVCLVHEKAKQSFRSGDRLAKLRLYRWGVAEQAATTALVLGLCRFGSIPGPSLGIRAPYSWSWTAATLVVLSVPLIWSAARLRPKAVKIRRRFQDSLGMLFPESAEERVWFGVLSAGAGIQEELIFRGFLFYYLGEYVPHINTAEKVLLTSLVFGLGHIYQGWKQSIITGAGGVLLALMYVFSGSLLLSLVFHAICNLRMLVMLPAESAQAVPAESAA